MPTKLYVGNLSFKVTESELQELFQKVGEVRSVKIITDRYTGQSRGFGFVEMANAEDASRAISELNGKSFKERQIIVNEARPEREDRRSGRREGKGKGRRY